MILKQIDTVLNKVTMYKLLAQGLTVLAIIGICASALEMVKLDTKGLIGSLVILVVVSFVANRLISTFWKVTPNTESWYITALVLFFILPPATTPERAIGIALAAFIAVASKYVLSVNGRHIFNPAAFAAFSVGSLGLLNMNWWIGSSALWPFALVYGLFVVRKVRKFKMLLTFASVSLVTSVITGLPDGFSATETLDFMITASPLIFLGTIMLTEPSTMPARGKQQLIFAALVGILFAWHPSVGPLFIYPETALLIGNLYAYAVSPKQSSRLRLKRIEKITGSIENFVFESKTKLDFMPGQYMEWTLAHKNVDIRGNRRTFTIASSPTEKEVMLGVKINERSSSFKKKLHTMQIGDTIDTRHVSGDFTLPIDTTKKITLIAGGIGITPFRSMLKYIIDTNQKRDVVLYYLVSQPEEIAYNNILQDAEAHGITIVKICPVKAPPTFKTQFDEALIKEITPDYAERITYISGPNAMVDSHRHLLHKIGVARDTIRTDHFSGY